MTGKYYLGISQGTAGSTAILFDDHWQEASKGYCETPVLYPRLGWVEHDAEKVWHSVLTAIKNALDNIGADASVIRCIGLNHEGESVVIWNRKTGIPVYNAIVWQDRRNAREAEELGYQYNEMVRGKTGLMIDTYFSATKYKWIMENVAGLREQAKQGELLTGTLDSWLLWKMTRGALHITDASTASRTMLFNVSSGQWDEELVTLFGLEMSMLPEIRDSAGVYGKTDPREFFDVSVPISATLVDQQAALVGNGCVNQGSIEVTYGTGCFMLLNTGAQFVASKYGLLPTVAWRLDGKTTFALDGGVHITGGATKWLQSIGVIINPSQSDALAREVADNGGVYFVPAFVGLAAPHWDSYASGMMIGINGSTQKQHLARAALEATAYQVRDVLDAMARDSNVSITAIRCNGGPTANHFLMQFQSDILEIPLEIPNISSSSALGSAFMGALGIGDVDSLRDISSAWTLSRRYEPQMGSDQRNALLYNWHRAIERAKYWVE